MGWQLLGVGGGGTVTPDQVAGLWGWWKNDDGTAGSWTDASGNGRHLTQGTAANQPAITTGVVNGQAVRRFDGTSDYMTAPDMSALTAGTVFVVFKLDADPPAATKTGFWNWGTGTQCHMPFTDGNAYDVFGTSVRKDNIVIASLSSAFVIYEVVSAASDWRNYLNGTNLSTTGTNTVGFPAANADIGRSSDVTNFLDGDVAEIVLYSSALSDTNRGVVRSYLQSKYAL